MHLAIRSVSKTYANGVRALHDITLDIPVGMYGRIAAGVSSAGCIVSSQREGDTSARRSLCGPRNRGARMRLS